MLYLTLKCMSFFNKPEILKHSQLKRLKRKYNFLFSEKDVQSTGNSPSITTKSPTTPVSSNTVTHLTRSITPVTLHTTSVDYHHDEDLPAKYSYDEPVST